MALNVGGVSAHSSITVLMPLKSYHPVYLRRALDSVTSQDCPAWRLLIVVEAADQGGFQEMLRSDLGDPRISLIANRGRRMAGAINTGMREAESSFVALLLADDLWSSSAVGLLREHIAAYPTVDVFHSSRVIIDSDDRRISSIYESRKQFRDSDFMRGSPVKHLLCWRRELALSIGGLDESLASIGVDDYDFPWTMAQAGASFEAIDEPLYSYRNHCDAHRLTTHTPLTVNVATVNAILKKHGVDLRTRIPLIFKRVLQGDLGGQCLYKSRVDQWVKERLGHDSRRYWRQPRYR